MNTGILCSFFSESTLKTWSFKKKKKGKKGGGGCQTLEIIHNPANPCTLDFHVY